MYRTDGPGVSGVSSSSKLMEEPSGWVEPTFLLLGSKNLLRVDFSAVFRFMLKSAKKFLSNCHMLISQINWSLTYSDCTIFTESHTRIVRIYLRIVTATNNYATSIINRIPIYNELKRRKIFPILCESFTPNPKLNWVTYPVVKSYSKREECRRAQYSGNRCEERAIKIFYRFS